MKIVLVGFMCAGKSKVGKILAEKLGWTYFDTDQEIEKEVGTSIAEFITKHGEGIFRDFEKQVVVQVSEKDQCVIATGGGVPMDPSNVKNLKKESVIFWLRVSPNYVLKRAGDLKKRPLIDPKDPLESVRTLLEQRRIFYSIADYTIDTDALSPQEVAQQVFKILPKLKTSK